MTLEKRFEELEMWQEMAERKSEVETAKTESEDMKKEKVDAEGRAQNMKVEEKPDDEEKNGKKWAEKNEAMKNGDGVEIRQMEEALASINGWLSEKKAARKGKENERELKKEEEKAKQEKENKEKKVKRDDEDENVRKWEEKCEALKKDLEERYKAEERYQGELRTAAVMMDKKEKEAISFYWAVPREEAKSDEKIKAHEQEIERLNEIVKEIKDDYDVIELDRRKLQSNNTRLLEDKKKAGETAQELEKKLRENENDEPVAERIRRKK